MTGRATRTALGLLASAVLVSLLLFLFVPGSNFHPPEAIAPHPFRWDRAQVFAVLEREFLAVRVSPSDAIVRSMDELKGEGADILGEIASSGSSLPEVALRQLEAVQFRVATLSASFPPLLAEAAQFMRQARVTVLRAAARWTLDRSAHEAIYRVVYGGRAALEEALVQSQGDALPAVSVLDEVPSQTPSVEIRGVRVHSGDILLSRGGAPTSALIARGNDFPGSFSHVALVHVDGETGRATVIEALIERGAVLTTPEEYLATKKLRILLMRLRPDHPAVAKDPLAPHRAASAMLARVRSVKIPYDFAMNWTDSDAFFCSEVIYHAYRAVGIELWSIRSEMSTSGLVRWLGSMGVRYFTTLVPSDLEYDPRPAPVVEWRALAALRDERFDNAVMDALLEVADRGAHLGYPWYRLAAARAVKAWSVVAAAVGSEPTIPPGMNAATALRVDALVHRVHPVLREDVETAASRFREQNGYEAPYWVLVALARAAIERHQVVLSPALQAP